MVTSSEEWCFGAHLWRAGVYILRGKGANLVRLPHSTFLHLPCACLMKLIALFL